MLKNPIMAAGIVFGAAVGGVSALLLAPRSGRENREVVKSKMDPIKNRVRRSQGESSGELPESLASRDADYLH
jgi:gas vesicle protein